jgi:hypothetical protein
LPWKDAASAIDQPFDALESGRLEFCVSLLNGDLQGGFFEHAVVYFLASGALGNGKGFLEELCYFTPVLYGLIKSVQMLVVQKANLSPRGAARIQPAHLPDKMRVRSPFAGLFGY